MKSMHAGELGNFRWLPRQGEPRVTTEWISQAVVKACAYLPVYTAIIVTLVLLVQIFGVPGT